MIGAVLAGGAGTRLGAPSKPAASVAGQALLSYPLAAIREVCDQVAVVCRHDTVLGDLPAGVLRWNEPDGRRHPAVGIAHALQRARGSVLVTAADMPFVTVRMLRELAAAAARAPDAAAVVGISDGRLQPVLGVYRPAALQAVSDAGDRPLAEVVESLAPVLVAVPVAEARSVNTPADLAAAERTLRGHAVS